MCILRANTLGDPPPLIFAKLLKGMSVLDYQRMFSYPFLSLSLSSTIAHLLHYLFSFSLKLTLPYLIIHTHSITKMATAVPANSDLMAIVVLGVGSFSKKLAR